MIQNAQVDYGHTCTTRGSHSELTGSYILPATIILTVDNGCWRGFGGCTPKRATITPELECVAPRALLLCREA